MISESLYRHILPHKLCDIHAPLRQDHRENHQPRTTILSLLHSQHHCFTIIKRGFSIINITGKIAPSTNVTMECLTNSKIFKNLSYELTEFAEGLSNLQERACIQARIMNDDGAIKSLLMFGIGVMLIVLGCSDEVEIPCEYAMIKDKFYCDPTSLQQSIASSTILIQKKKISCSGSHGIPTKALLELKKLGEACKLPQDLQYHLKNKKDLIQYAI